MKSRGIFDINVLQTLQLYMQCVVYKNCVTTHTCVCMYVLTYVYKQSMCL